FGGVRLQCRRQRAMPGVRVAEKIELGLSKYWYCGIDSQYSKYWNKYWSIDRVAARKVRY
ncbi:hypothetical protein OAO87_02730, partial [bacterium]|nr:hypothetical protein [bacterium]